MTNFKFLQVPFQNPLIARLIYVLWLAALAWYIFGGMTLTPFHADEATQIAMSRDYAAIFQQGNLDAVRYQEAPADPAAQELRLINGVLNKYLIGVAWNVRGFTVDDLNQQWDWGADYTYNVNNGHKPSDELLMTARIPSTALYALGLLPMFALGWLVGGRTGAFVATFIYALHPALLINGRRAMMEGGLIAFSLFTVVAGVWFARTRSWIAAVALGLAAGLALASKHTAVFTLIAVYGAALLGLVIGAERKPSAIAKLVVSGVVALLLFYALNPAWWGDPFGRASQVLLLRNDLLAGQAAAFGGYTGTGEALGGWLRQGVLPVPQYYEVPAWQGYIGMEIVLYETSIYDGLRGLNAAGLEGVLFDLLFPLAALSGLGALLGGQGIEGNTRRLVLTWAVIAVLTTALLTPVEWQRYYIPSHLAIIVLVTAGAAWSMRPVKRETRVTPKAVTLAEE